MFRIAEQRRSCCIIILLLLCCQFAIEPSNAETYLEAFVRGKKLEESGDDEGAINAYMMAKGLLSSINTNDVATDPRLPLARLYAKCGRYAEAEQEYQALLPNGGTQLKAEYGQFLMNQGKFSASSGIWTEMLAQNPNDTAALYLMGHCLEASDSIDTAKDYYNKVISLAPKSEVAELAEGRLERLGNAIEKRQSGTFFSVDPEFGQVGLGWWDLRKMPIHVYIDEGSSVKGYRSEMKNFVLRAMDAWRQASGGKIHFVLDPPDPKGEQGWKEALGKNTDPLVRVISDPSLPDDPVKTGIHVHWTDALGGRAIGLAWTNPFGNRTNEKGERNCLITNGHVWLHTNCLADGKAMPNISAANSALLEKQDRMLSEVAVHEFGHALGLMHSTNPKDVMCAGIYGLNSEDLIEGRTLSSNDLGSLKEHYNNFVGSGFPTDIVTVKDEPSKDPKSKSVSVFTSVAANKSVSSASADPKLAGNPRGPAQNNFAQEFNAVMFDINSKRYADSLAKLNKVLQIQPANQNAHYLRAITFVMMHNYTEAEKEYALVIKLVPGTELSKRAEEGLKKIKRTN